jgi:predicted metal-dependent phosphoesterase TrpH
MNEAARYPCDLHCHTVRSDGNDTPRELIDNAARLGLRALGITDHDIQPPACVPLDEGGEMEIVAYAARRGVTLVPGYEFSCDTHVDDVHICGYRLDWGHPDLLAEVAAAKRSKSDAYEELCRRLTALGMPLDWEADLLHYTAPDGAPAVRDADAVQRKHVFEAMAARGHAKTWSEAKIFVRDNPDLNVSRRKIDPRAAIELIHRCGGTAILAHPYLIDETVKVPGQSPRSRAAYIDDLIAAGLDGIEASYSYDKTTYKGQLTPDEIEARVRRDYAARVRFVSGGSDYHADHKKGAKTVRQLGERGLSVAEFEAIFGPCSAPAA